MRQSRSQVRHGDTSPRTPRHRRAGGSAQSSASAMPAARAEISLNVGLHGAGGCPLLVSLVIRLLSVMHDNEGWASGKGADLTPTRTATLIASDGLASTSRVSYSSLAERYCESGGAERDREWRRSAQEWFGGRGDETAGLRRRTLRKKMRPKNVPSLRCVICTIDTCQCGG